MDCENSKKRSFIIFIEIRVRKSIYFIRRKLLFVYSSPEYYIEIILKIYLSILYVINY